MSSLDTLALSNAEAALAVANTPLFLARKLSEDPIIQQFAEDTDGEELLKFLATSVSAKPATLREAVVPYALLVALFKKSEFSFLQRSASISPSYDDDWFTQIRSALLKMYRATTNVEITVPNTYGSIIDMRSNAGASCFQIGQ